MNPGQTGPGAAGDPAWAAAVVLSGDSVVDEAMTEGASPERPTSPDFWPCDSVR
jgi:hypothetical protein